MSDLDDAVKGVLTELLARLGAMAADKARPLIPSETLADALAVVESQDEPYQVFVQIPHYWAAFVHDGHKAFGPTGRCTYLVWFRDKLMDPRTQYGTQYPVREGDIQRLSKEQFQYGLELNRIARAAGERPPMIVAKFQPRIEQGVPFFSDGMADFSSDVAPVVRETFEALLDSILPDQPPGEATFSIRFG